jgi:DNA invertase Pin-like site-specific DNA recombinase
LLTSTISASMEYLKMPTRRKRAALYVRESDVTLADSTTIESAIKACKDHCEKENYLLLPQHEYKEAISAYTVPYFKRPQLMAMLEAAARGEFDTLVITEVRALSRKGAGEVFLIYEALTKANVSLETIHEKFSDDPVGELVLSFKATYAKLEREQSYLRLARGRAHRIEIGQAPNGGKKAYGYILVDSEREISAIYQLNTTIFYVDRFGKEWSEYDVCMYIFDLLKEAMSLRKICHKLNDLGIPTPQSDKHKGAHWRECTIRAIATNPIYIGEVWANKYVRVGKSMKKRPREEWIRLPDAPAMIDPDTFYAIQKQFTINKQESLRNNSHANEELGLLRAGFCRCGICGYTMHVVPSDNREGSFAYSCRRRSGGDQGIIKNHRTQIHLKTVDKAAVENIIEAVNDPEFVRAKVAKLREENKPPPVSQEEINAKLDDITARMRRIYNLAEHATDDKTTAELTERMNELEQERRDTEGLLYVVADEEEICKEIEAEIARFEEWAARVRVLLNDPDYKPTYDELRLAVRAIGIQCVVYPTIGDWPFRMNIDATVPEIVNVLNKSVR